MPIANKIERLLGWEATRTEPMAEKKAKELIQIRYNPSTGVSGNDRRVRGAAWIDSSHAERWLLLITATLSVVWVHEIFGQQACIAMPNVLRRSASKQARSKADQTAQRGRISLISENSLLIFPDQ